jgi:hypothetical protein
MTAACEAKLVVGCPCVGPTCSAVTRHTPCSPGWEVVLLRAPWFVDLVLGRLLRLSEGLEAAPDGPDDPGHLVGDGDGGLVVDVGL